MKDISEIIRSRRNTKPEEFSGKLIEASIIEEILENANWAPTHGYTEPWRYWVYHKEGLKSFGKLHAELFKKHTPPELFNEVKYNKILNRTEKTSHLIVIGMKRGVNPKIPQIEEIEATACSVMNMWLTATSYGLAAYWGSGGMTYHQSLKDHFGLTNKEDEILGLLYLGYPEKEALPGRRITSIQDKTEWIDS